MSAAASSRRARTAAAALLVALGTALVTSRAGALNIVATYDQSIVDRSDGATIMSTINGVISTFNTKIQDNTTVNITFTVGTGTLGGSSTPYQTLSYSSLLSALRNHASSLDDAVALSHLPDGPGNPVTGNSNIQLSDALARALGLISEPQTEPALIGVSILHRDPRDPAAATEDVEKTRRELLARAASPTAIQADGTISVNFTNVNVTTGATPPGQYSLVSVVSHEIDEVLGSGSALNGLSNGAPVPTGPVRVQDLFRYNSIGGRSLGTASSLSSYCSFDGTNLIVQQNQNSPDGKADYSDWWSPNATNPRVQDAYQSSGVDPVMGDEWRLLDVLGWSFGPRGVWLDFNYGGLYFGLYDQPYNTLAAAINSVPTGGLILLKGGGVTSELPNITKPLLITTVGGTSRIGQ